MTAPLPTVVSTEWLAAHLGEPDVATCGSGVGAAVLTLGLYLLGRGDTAVYDGSWSEWGGSSDTTVET